jgi:hypothetical protein
MQILKGHDIRTFEVRYRGPLIMVNLSQVSLIYTSDARVYQLCMFIRMLNLVI